VHQLVYNKNFDYIKMHGMYVEIIHFVLFGYIPTRYTAWVSKKLYVSAICYPVPGLQFEIFRLLHMFL
jgi:hypothetical protein